MYHHSGSPFSCLACGIVEEMSLELSRRSSSSRRDAHESPVPRSRSSERYKEEKTPVKIDDDYGVVVDKQQKSRSKGRGHHERAMSDPLDAQEELFPDCAVVASYVLEAETTNTLPLLPQDKHPLPPTQHRRQSSVKGTLHHHRHQPLSTLPRFPVVETHNKNCWSEPPVSIFQVRGGDYISTKKKVSSGPYLLRARGCDIFLADENSPELEEKTCCMLGGHVGRIPTLAFNFRFPWGFMALYFEIPNHLVPFMVHPNNSRSRNNGLEHTESNSKLSSSKLTPPERMLALWFQGNTAFKNDRLKLVPYVAEGPWVVRNMVTGRPALIGKKLPVTYQLLHAQHPSMQPLLIATLDIGSSSAAAKRIVSVCRRYMSALTVDIGLVVQGDEEGELPEQMMGAIRIHAADPLQAVSLQK